MCDDSQLSIPPSFVALFVRPGRSKPDATRQHIGARYEYCEDLATLLVDQAQARLWDLKIGEDEVLQRIHQGLLAGTMAGSDEPGATGVNAAEAAWVSTRLAELLQWQPLAAPRHAEGPTD